MGIKIECGTCQECDCSVRLKHNFELGKGLKEGLCCTLFAKEKDGFVLEVEPDSTCEEFRKRKE